MRKNHVYVSKDFKDGETDANFVGARIPGDQDVQPNAPGEFEINDIQPLVIKLFNKNVEEETRDPRKQLLIDENTYYFYIKLASYLDYDFNVCMTESGWIVSQKYSPFLDEPVLVPLVPEKLNIWPVRLFLLPFELVIKTFNYAGEFVMLPFEVLFYKSNSMRMVNKLVLVPLLPKKLNIWLFRLLITPFEASLKVPRYIGMVAKNVKHVMCYRSGPTGNTNITVGSGGPG